MNKTIYDFCNAWCPSKSHRLPSLFYYYLQQAFRTCVHKSMSPTPVVSSNGYRDCNAFTDAFSIFTWIYFLKNKLDTLSAFMQFRSLVELQLGHRIKSLQANFFWIK